VEALVCYYKDGNYIHAENLLSGVSFEQQKEALLEVVNTLYADKHMSIIEAIIRSNTNIAVNIYITVAELSMKNNLPVFEQYFTKIKSEDQANEILQKQSKQFLYGKEYYMAFKACQRISSSILKIQCILNIFLKLSEENENLCQLMIREVSEELGHVPSENLYDVLKPPLINFYIQFDHFNTILPLIHALQISDDERIWLTFIIIDLLKDHKKTKSSFIRNLLSRLPFSRTSTIGANRALLHSLVLENRFNTFKEIVLKQTELELDFLYS